MAFLLVSNNEMPLVRHRFTAAVPCLALDSVDRLGRNDSLRRATSKNSTDSECDIVIGEYMADSYDWVQADILCIGVHFACLGWAVQRPVDGKMCSRVFLNAP